MDKFKMLSVKAFLAITIIAIFYFSVFLKNVSQSNYLRINFLDVGQGDSILIETPQGKYILIDAGESQSIVSKISEIMPIQEKVFDLAILTHPHADHLGGFNYLSDYYSFAKVLQLPMEHTSEAYLGWLQYLSENSISVSPVYSGDLVNIEDDLALKVLWPENEQSLVDLSLNDTSIVFMLEYKNFRALFMGDAETYVEQEILSDETYLDASVIKIGHHGSITSSSEAFLQRVTPQDAIISVGKDNKFGHPSADVISRLESNGIGVYRTDELGNIKIVSDGKSFWIEE